MICPRCKKEKGKLTVDHIVPKWLVIRVQNIGFSYSLSKKSNKQLLCSDCNIAKAGKIEWENPKVRHFMLELNNFISNNLNKHRPKLVTITPKCLCNNHDTKRI